MKLETRTLIGDIVSDDNCITIEENSAAIIMRNYLSLRDKSKKYNSDDYEKIYKSLNKEYKSVVDSAVKDLLKEEVLEQHFGVYFREMINSITGYDGKPVNTYHIATCLSTINTCNEKRGITTQNNYLYNKINENDINQKLQSFLKKKKSLSYSEAWEQEISDLLSFDRAILVRGYGSKYDIDLEYVQKLLDERNVDKEQFYNKVWSNYIDCFKCSERDCEFKKKYMNAKQYNKKEIGKVIANMLNVPVEDIVDEITISIEIKDFPFEQYFEKLNTKEQRQIINLIRNLFFVQHKID